VNTVAFHPLYSVLASVSDDSTVKIWDWESGDLERTLKGHTKRVSGCHYNSNGTTLGELEKLYLICLGQLVLMR
jgi:platelet-activating factor acetylhydrolase IB subunit alpha